MVSMPDSTLISLAGELLGNGVWVSFTTCSERNHRRISMARIVCSECGRKFKAKDSHALSGAAAGAATGGLIGSKIGLALGPLGAIAGTIPGAVIGGAVGGLAGDKVVKCPRCGATNYV